MSTFFKPLLALVISILIFAGFYYLVDDEILVFIQTHFYHPTIVSSYQKENNTDAEHIQKYIWELQSKFTETLNNPSVRSSFLYNQSDEDIYERSRVFGLLLETTMGLQYVQFIDINGIRIHYSTHARDIISQSQQSTAYRNYYEDTAALPFDRVSVPAGSATKFTMDEQSDRIIFSFPFNDSMGVYRGTALFTVSVRSFAERLIAEGRLLVSEDVAVITEPPGFLLGSPGSSKSNILTGVSAIWRDSLQNMALQRNVTVDAESSGAKFFLISSRTNDGLFFGRLISEDLFAIPDSMNLILNLSIILTFFLSFYFLLNLKPNAVTLVRVRIKRLRESLFEQLYINKTGMERAKWILQLEQRRDEIRSELKFNLKLRPRNEKIIDGIVDKSWDELLDILKSGSGAPIIITGTQPVPENESSVDDTPEAEKIDKVEALEDVDEIEALDEVEEIEEVEALEDVDEVEALDEVEEIEEVEALEDVDEIEALDEVEEIEEAEALEDEAEAEALDEVEEIEEIEEIDQAGEIDGISDHVEIIGSDSDDIAAAPAAHTGRGLLAAASSGKQVGNDLFAAVSDDKPKRKGLLALANEIEFSDEYPVVEEHQEETWSDEGLNIVSPFSSMFSSLDDNS